MVGKSVIGTVVLGVLLVGVGTGLVFAGFELAAYEKTIADREVTTEGDVIEESKEVYQLPDGNWTYNFEYTYEFDQEAEITDQGLEDVYPYEMNSSQTYQQFKSGGKHDDESDARDAMQDHFEDDGSTVIVYVDPFYPSEGSLSDVETMRPKFLQWGGSLVMGLGLALMAGMARRITT